MCHRVLSYSKVDGILVFGLGEPDDAIDEYDSWEVVVENAAIDDSFSQLFYFEIGLNIGEDGMYPSGDMLSGELCCMRGGFVHRDMNN